MLSKMWNQFGSNFEVAIIPESAGQTSEKIGACTEALRPIDAVFVDTRA